jgi:hypothetical protein
MIDTRALASALEQARSARLAAEDAWCDVEEVLWQVQHGPRYWRRIAETTPLDEDDPVDGPAPLTH